MQVILLCQKRKISGHISKNGILIQLLSLSSPIKNILKQNHAHKGVIFSVFIYCKLACVKT